MKNNGKKHRIERIFDYVIIGAGSAGGIIAKELTDDRKTSVLVLEAGTNIPNSSPSIADADALANDNRLSYNMLTRTELNIMRQSRLRNGRVIGGSSQHNFMVAVRGSRELYDEWARIAGSQWSYDALRPLFKKLETYTGETQDPDERGTDGPIFVRQQIIPDSGLIQVLNQAVSDVLGIPIVEDYNTGIRDCTYFKTQYTQKAVHGTFERSSTTTGYLNKNIVTQGNELHPDEFGVMGRKLIILAKSTANKILFIKKKGENVAVGVEFVRNGMTNRVFARKGIILSAGIFSSVILQRSGIGRPEDLERVGIRTLVNSPNVGYNFQSQFFAGMGIEVETSRLLQVLAADPIPAVLGSFKKEEGPGRRLQLLGFPVPSFVPIQDVFINGWEFNPERPTNVMSIGISDLNPKSRGSIIIAHSDPEALPSINLNPLDDPDDLRYMIDKYIETYRVILRARELDPGGIYRVVYPNEKIFEIADEAEKRRLLANFVRASYVNFDHFAGQCRIGPDIQQGVVDGFMNVFGTRNLKVADLSISPIIPDGNTCLPAQVIGLNAVRFIKQAPCRYLFDDDELLGLDDDELLGNEE
ncbi:MAG TPA: GMC family oxidoreductase [Clostridiaceae bacterium]|nr:GMC family oxidoreductase [Clostridiaceae bacterium]